MHTSLTTKQNQTEKHKKFNFFFLLKTQKDAPLAEPPSFIYV
jgi:hypothetical protein